MAAPVAFFSFKTVDWQFGNFHLGGNLDACAGHYLSLMEEVSPSDCHAMEFGNYNNCHTLYLELGFCLASTDLDLYIFAGELEAKDASPNLIRHRVVWNGIFANEDR